MPVLWKAFTIGGLLGVAVGAFAIGIVWLVAERRAAREEEEARKLFGRRRGMRA